MTTENPDYKFGHHLKSDFVHRNSLGIVGVIMGSRSDWPFMKPCTDMLELLEIPFELGVVSAHRTSGRMESYGKSAANRGIKIIIACAGGSAHLPGMIASENSLPVLGVAPKKSDTDAVGSMIAMPAGIPLAYMGGGSAEWKNAGAVNAALLAAQILALFDEGLLVRLEKYRFELTNDVPYTCF